MLPFKLCSLKLKLLITVLFFIIAYLVLYLNGAGLETFRPIRTDVPYSESLPSEHRFLPLSYWNHRRQYPQLYSKSTCSNFPSPNDIKYAAMGWQHLPITNGSAYLYAAYWDHRGEEAVVRLLIYADVVALPQLYCFFWFEGDSNPVTVPTTVDYGWSPAWGGPKPGVNEPYILSCTARHNNMPAAVSVATELCSNPTNALAVQGSLKSSSARPPISSTSIGVCLKWLHYKEDISGQLSEWIELIQAFGANTIFIYVLKVHPNTERLLQYYESRGIIQVTKLVHPPQLRSDQYDPGQRNFHDLRQELLPLNDCLYRAVGSRTLRWLAVFDMDEIIVPIRDGTYQQLIEKEVAATGSSPDVLVFLNYYFLDGAQRERAAPPPAHMLAHVWRAREHNPKAFNVKSFFSVSSVLKMHNHYPISCGDHGCTVRDVEVDTARLHHYRVRCDNDQANCTALYDTVRDDTLSKWSYVLPRVANALTELGIPFGL